MSETPEIVLPAKPDDHLTIIYDGNPRELFMSFLRLNSLLRIIEDPTRILMVTVDPDLGENALRVLLAEKGGSGTMFDFELDESAVSGDDVERILCWARDHLIYFFTKRFQSLAETGKTLEPIVTGLRSQVAGSESSTSETASAGPST